MVIFHSYVSFPEGSKMEIGSIGGPVGTCNPSAFHTIAGILGFDPLRPQGNQGDQLAIEEEGGIWRDWPYSRCSVGQLWGDLQLPFAAHAHGQNALIPAGDHLSSAHGKLQWIAL